MKQTGFLFDIPVVSPEKTYRQSLSTKEVGDGCIVKGEPDGYRLFNIFIIYDHSIAFDPGFCIHELPVLTGNPEMSDPLIGTYQSVFRILESNPDLSFLNLH